MHHRSTSRHQLRNLPQPQILHHRGHILLNFNGPLNKSRNQLYMRRIRNYLRALLSKRLNSPNNRSKTSTQRHSSQRLGTHTRQSRIKRHQQSRDRQTSRLQMPTNRLRTSHPTRQIPRRIRKLNRALARGNYRRLDLHRKIMPPKAHKATTSRAQRVQNRTIRPVARRPRRINPIKQITPRTVSRRHQHTLTNLARRRIITTSLW